MKKIYHASVTLGSTLSALSLLPRFCVSLCFIVFLFSDSVSAQTACGGMSPTVLAKWDFNSGSASVCNGATGKKTNGGAPLSQDKNKYCPTTNAGCGKAILGSKGHQNTGFFSNGMCNSDFFMNYSKLGHITSWDYKFGKNIYITYEVPAGTAACISNLQLDLMGTPQLTAGMGVTVLRNGVEVETQTFPSPSVGTKTINFVKPELCTDGSTAVTFTIYYGFWFNAAPSSSGRLGIDNVVINGLAACGSPSPSAEATTATCGAAGANADAKIKLLNVGATDKFDYNEGATYTGSATYATASAIPVGGIIVSNLPNPSSSKQYTVRIFNATCYVDKTITLEAKICPAPCAIPTGEVITPIQATCTGTTANNDAQVSITAVTGGDKVAISAGGTYTGGDYAAAQSLVAGAYTFTGLNNPICEQTYTIRLFNGAACYVDRTVHLEEKICGNCAKSIAEIIRSDQTDPNSTPNNGVQTEDDVASAEICKDNKFIDLKLTKTVSPNTGTICGSAGTNFVWTITLQNEGTMDATNIQVADLLPDGLHLLSSSPDAPTFTLAAGWLIPSLAAGASTTLTLTTQALRAGTFTNCAEVNAALPMNDPDSTPGNGTSGTDDDWACASITVTGSTPPTVSKEFSPWDPKTGTAFRLMLKFNNQDTQPITLTEDFVDVLPNSPAQMVVATTPSVQTFGMILPAAGITANAAGTSITVPKGTVLAPGLNQVWVEVNVPSDGYYCNDIAAGALKTTNGDNCLASQACVTAATANNIPPLITKKFASPTANTNTDVLLTLTIENRNLTNMTLDQDFHDFLPTGLVMGAGTNTGTCAGVAAFAVGDTLFKMNTGTIIPSGSCTIIVPVRSATAGHYCNTILHNSMLVTVNGESGVGNRGLAQDCITLTATPCTTLGTVSIVPSPSNPVAQSAAVTLTASGTGVGANSVMQWASANGVFSNVGINPTIWTAPATDGTYTVTLTVNNNLTGYGTCTATATTTVTVGTVLTPCTVVSTLSATATPSSMATGASAMLNVTGTGITTGTTTFSWSGTGGFSSTTQDPSTGVLSTAGGYSYTVTATNANGTGTCTATATTSLTVSTALTPCTVVSTLSATATPSSMATGASATLNVTGTGITTGTTTFSWSGTGGFSSTTQNPSTGALSTAGGYSYTVTATNANGTGTCTATATTSLTVSTVLTPCTVVSTLSATATPSSMATGASATLNVTGTGITTGITSFSWTGGSAGLPASFTASTQNPSTGALSTAGGYSYTVTATNANGTGTCTATATTSLTVSSVPVFDLALRKTLASGQSATVATGSTVTFSISIINQGSIDASNVQITDYIPAGLTLNDAAWTAASGGKTTLIAPITSLAAGATITRNISFTVTTSGTIINYAEISAATGGTDVDSTPDNDGANDGTPQDDVITGKRKINPTDDEDDHDLAAITVHCGTANCYPIKAKKVK